MSEEHRRTFDASEGGAAVDQPLLRAVLSYAPFDPPGESALGPHPSDWLELPAESGAGVVRFRLACADELGEEVQGPFGSKFYEGLHFEVIVPHRLGEQDALLMIHLLDRAAPARFEFEMDLPQGWSVKVEFDGSVTIADFGGQPQVFVGVPWAFDDEYKRIPIRYTLENGKLVQNVGVDASTRFPVLIDPDPDAILTGDGRLITEAWLPRLAPTVDDILLPSSRTRLP